MTKSFGRTAHGKGGSALLRIETPPPDELSDASNPSLALGQPQRDDNGSFLPGHTISRGKRQTTSRGGALLDLEAQGDDAWKLANQWGKRWAKHRRGELTQAPWRHLSRRQCSSGVGRACHGGCPLHPS
jgi:hypothetical protein